MGLATGTSSLTSGFASPRNCTSAAAFPFALPRFVMAGAASLRSWSLAGDANGIFCCHRTIGFNFENQFIQIGTLFYASAFDGVAHTLDG